MRLRELVQVALDDRQVLTDPPQSEQERGSLADTVFDHLYVEIKRLTAAGRSRHLPTRSAVLDREETMLLHRLKPTDPTSTPGAQAPLLGLA